MLTHKPLSCAGVKKDNGMFSREYTFKGSHAERVNALTAKLGKGDGEGVAKVRIVVSMGGMVGGICDVDGEVKRILFHRVASNEGGRKKVPRQGRF